MNHNSNITIPPCPICGALPGYTIAEKPVYERTYYLFGLLGVRHIYVDKTTTLIVSACQEYHEPYSSQTPPSSDG